MIADVNGARTGAVAALAHDPTISALELTLGDGIGAPLKRFEDARLLRGAGRYVSDIEIAGQLHCVILRSPYAHATIRSVRVATAAAAPGVIAVLTGSDMAADEVGPMPVLWAVKSSDGVPMAEPPRYALARGKVRYVGEAIAAVIARSRDEAQDGVELVEVDYEPCPVVADAREAALLGAPLLHDGLADNVCFRWVRGDAAAVERAFSSVEHIARIELVNNRLIGAAIEPRAVLADGSADKLTLYSSTQVPHHIRRFVAEQLSMPEGSIRVVAPDVGGGFGYKGKHYPEEVVLAWAARRLRRPVKWVSTRSEAFLSDYQSRDHATTAELALDRDGQFLALRVDTTANLGAYPSTVGAAVASAIYTSLFAGMYRTPAIVARSTGVFTNTVPTDAYRGAGRPEACYALERLVDQAARELRLDRAEIRRRNLIPVEAMPYKTPIGPRYDSGNFPKLFSRALELSNYAGFESRRTSASRSGRLRGFGFACYIDSSGVAPSRYLGVMGARAGFYEAAHIRVQPDGGVHAFLGTHSHGQGHATTFAQIIASTLGVPASRVEIFEGDTDQVPYGTGTFGSRSIAVGGSALFRASDKIVAKGKIIAAHLLEAAPADMIFEQGRFSVAGTDRQVSFGAVAKAAYIPHNFPFDTLEPGLQDTAVYDPVALAFSNGVHLCEAEVDVDTGAIEVVNYWAVDDIGTVINPMIVEAQIQGGVAQGLGQALSEKAVYDPDSGQLLTGSFMDYGIPHAHSIPAVVSEFDQSQPCTHNPLGSKGVGEAGAVGSPAVLVSAVLDALRTLGVLDIEMPLTPGRVWQAIRSADPGTTSSKGARFATAAQEHP